MKKSLLIFMVIFLLMPANTFALSATVYDANNLIQSEQFRLELIQDAISRKENINLNLKNLTSQ